MEALDISTGELAEATGIPPRRARRDFVNSNFRKAKAPTRPRDLLGPPPATVKDTMEGVTSHE